MDDETMSAPTQAAPAASPTPESHLSHFQFERILNQDQPARRIILLGHIPCPGDSSTTSHQALLLVEHAPHPTSAESFATFAASLSNLQTLSHNDIYSWFLASSPIPSLKLTLISPCTPAHIAKYTPQRPRIVHETPAIYAQHVRPWIADKGREGKKLAWIENALSGRAEADKVLYREEGEDGFNIMPDLNWDTKTKESMHLLVLVEKGRKGLWSLRDLGKGDGKWLRHVRESIVRVVVGGSVVVGVEEDEIRCYVHYHPTYYHFHIHVAHAALDAGMGQSIGKAWILEDLIERVEMLPEGKTMADVTITIGLGDQTEIWKDVFGPLKGAGKLDEWAQQ